jgi:hypothetical protein
VECHCGQRVTADMPPDIRHLHFVVEFSPATIPQLKLHP